MQKLMILILFVSSLAFSMDYSDEDLKDIRWKQPKREVSVIVTKEGYYPEKIVAFKGEKVKFYVTGASDDDGCLIVKDHKVFLSARKGKIDEGEIVVSKAGEYPIYCPTNNMKGTLMVMEKKRKEPKRKIATEIKVKEWMPKEY